MGAKVPRAKVAMCCAGSHVYVLRAWDDGDDGSISVEREREREREREHSVLRTGQRHRRTCYDEHERASVKTTTTSS